MDKVQHKPLHRGRNRPWGRKNRTLLGGKRYIEERYRERRNAIVLWNFAGTEHFKRYREGNVTGRNVIERFHIYK